MSKPHDIYKKLKAGGELTLADLEAAHKHFAQLTVMLANSGPLFAHATLQSNSIEGELQLYRDELDMLQCEPHSGLHSLACLIR